MVKAFRTRRDLLLHLMQDIHGLKCNKPEGAFYLFPNVTYFYGKKNGDYVIQNGDDLCLYLLDRAQVALVPGSAFGDPSCIRISYATSAEQLTEAMRRIKVALSELS
jgi:aspartate aminotransferase